MIIPLERLADGSAILAPARRAIKLPAGWTVQDHPLDVLTSVAGGAGEVTGYLELVPPAYLSSQRVFAITGTIDVVEDGFASLAAGVKSFTKTIGGVEPTRRILGVTYLAAGAAAGFANGAGATYTLSVGWVSLTTALVNAANVDHTTDGNYHAGNGVDAVSGFQIGALQLQMTVTSNADLNTATQGSTEVIVTAFIP